MLCGSRRGVRPAYVRGQFITPMNTKNKLLDTRLIADRRFTKAKSLANKLEVHPKTIFRWADAGHIGRYKVNARVVLFDEQEVVAFIEKSRTGDMHSKDFGRTAA